MFHCLINLYRKFYISSLTSKDHFTFHHQPQWIFSHFSINLNGYFHISSSTSMHIFTFHHQPQWIFSHFLINHNRTSFVLNNTQMMHFHHVNPLTNLSNMTSVVDSKLLFQHTNFLISLFRDLPPGINSAVSLLTQALFTWT
jgi:hypothetical protein